MIFSLPTYGKYIYPNIYTYVIFAVKGREALIRREWQEELYRYMAGALKNYGHTPYIINGGGGSCVFVVWHDTKVSR